MISLSVPSLALCADVAMRRASEETLRRTQAELDRRVRERTAALGRRQYPSAGSPAARQSRQLVVGHQARPRGLVRSAVRDLRRRARGLRAARSSSSCSFVHPDDRVQVEDSIDGALRVRQGRSATRSASCAPTAACAICKASARWCATKRARRSACSASASTSPSASRPSARCASPSRATGSCCAACATTRSTCSIRKGTC